MWWRRKNLRALYIGTQGEEAATFRKNIKKEGEEAAHGTSAFVTWEKKRGTTAINRQTRIVKKESPMLIGFVILFYL